MFISGNLMSRLRRLFLCDCHFFVTCNLARKRIQLDEREFRLLSDAIGSARNEHGFVLTAWVFLPDHWHAVVYPPYPLTISETMKIIKVKSTLQVNRHSKGSGSLWQARFFDHALRTVGDHHKCIDYIHMNPVRRKLVQLPEQWPWSSIHDYNGSWTSVLPIDRINLPLDPATKLIPSW
jgi:putative transposase